MIRNLKVLGLALVAMLTMGVASASAAEFHSEAGSTTLAGTQSTTNTFTTDSGTIHCSTATFSGTSPKATTTNQIVTPNYSGCKSTGFIEANVTVHHNGCEYNIKANGEVVIEGCNSGSGMIVTAPFCTITVKPQTLKSVAFTNTGAGATREIIVDANVAGIHYVENGFACKQSGATKTNGTYTGSVRVTGTAGGAHTGIWWT